MQSRIHLSLLTNSTHMNKKGLFITLAVAVVIAAVTYILTVKNQNNNSNVTQDPISYTLSQDVVSKIESGIQDDVFVIESNQNYDSETATYTYETVEGGNKLADFDSKQLINSTAVTAIENGDFLQETKQHSTSQVKLFDPYDNTEYPLFDVTLMHDESLQGLTFSLKEDTVYASYIQEYSPTNYQNGYGDQVVNTRILKYDFGSGTISQVFSYSDSGNAVSIVAAEEEYLVLVRYSTVISQASYFTYDFASKQETPLDVTDVRETVISPDKSKMLFVQGTDLGGSFQAKDLKLFSFASKNFINADFSAPSLATTGLEAWPNYSVLQDVVWSKDSQELVFLKSTFSNSDINNATIDLLDMTVSTGDAKDLSTFRTETFSAQGLLGKIGDTVYVSGAINGVSQLRSYPGGKLLYSGDIPGLLLYTT